MNNTPDRDNVTNEIPPEGDAYDAQRQEELYAAITNKAALVRRHAEMVRGNEPSEQMHDIVQMMAQMERDIARLSLELHNSRQGKNLNTFLIRMDASLAANSAQMTASLDQSATHVMSSIAIRLDEITSFVQQGLVIAREARATGLEALGVGREALTVSKSNSARLARVEKDVVALKKGLKTSKDQWDDIMMRLDAGTQDMADLRKRIEALGVLAEEHNRLAREHAQVAKDVAELKAWRLSFDRAPAAPPKDG